MAKFRYVYTAFWNDTGEVVIQNLVKWKNKIYKHCKKRYKL